MARRMPYAAQRVQRTEIFRLVPASLTGSFAQSLTGVPEGTYHCTAKKTSTGVYQIQLNSAQLYAGARIPNVTCQALHATLSLTAVVAAVTVGGLITINVFTTTSAAATDATQLFVTVEGSDVNDQV